MDVSEFLNRVRQHENYGNQIEHVEVQPEREGIFADPSSPMPTALTQLLQQLQISQLYAHQATALELTRAGRDWVVVTGTASGKTLCYNVPILETCLQNPAAR